MITIQNLPEQKLSDLFESVLYDLERAEANEISINMSYYSNSEFCTVCLGGAAVCGFMSDYSKDTLKQISDGIEITEAERFRLVDMARMFDSFRRGSLHEVWTYYNNFSLKKLNRDKMRNVINEIGDLEYFAYYPDMRKLRSTIRRFITVLTKHEL